jgi:hypothetical protein
MLTVQSLRDLLGPALRESVSLGEAGTVDELHALLRDRVGEFKITGTVTVQIDLETPVGDDRTFVEHIALAANGHRPAW